MLRATGAPSGESKVMSVLALLARAFTVAVNGMRTMSPPPATRPERSCTSLRACRAFSNGSCISRVQHDCYRIGIPPILLTVYIPVSSDYRFTLGFTLGASSLSLCRCNATFIESAEFIIEYSFLCPHLFIAGAIL